MYLSVACGWRSGSPCVTGDAAAVGAHRVQRDRLLTARASRRAPAAPRGSAMHMQTIRQPASRALPPRLAPGRAAGRPFRKGSAAAPAASHRRVARRAEGAAVAAAGDSDEDSEGSLAHVLLLGALFGGWCAALGLQMFLTPC